jgi:hypothetical protein
VNMQEGEGGAQFDSAQDRPAGHTAGPYHPAALLPLSLHEVANELMPIAG